jgi:prolipoprotein diacylglyceryltransferase
LYEGIPYLVLFLLLEWLYLKKIKKLPPGFLMSFFAIFMFSVRFLVEFVKENQSDFEADIPLNMGQWLSLPLLVAGIIVMVIIVKRNKGKGQDDPEREMGAQPVANEPEKKIRGNRKGKQDKKNHKDKPG